MKLTDLRDLELIKGDLNIDYEYDITGTTVTGVEPLNNAENKLFLWKFREEDVKDFSKIYSLLREDKISEKVRLIIYGKVKEKCRDMLQEGICPVECMLYTSKEINNFINNDRTLVNYMSMVIYEITMVNKEKVIGSLEHIVVNWHWTPQLKIVIAALGRIKNSNLLEKAYYRFFNDNNLKLDLFRALINSGREEVVDYILQMISLINENSAVDKEISKCFKDKFKTVFSDDALKKAYSLLRSHGISSLARKTITYISGRDAVSISNSSSKNLGDLIVKAKSLKEFDSGISEFEELLKVRAHRKAAIIALRFTGEKSIGRLVYNTLLREKCSNMEVKEGIISLGILKYTDAYELIEKYLDVDQYKVYCYAYFILLGETRYCNLLSEELFKEEYVTYDETAKAINQCINSCAELKECINNSFNYFMEHCDENKQLKILNILKEVLKKCLNKNIEESWYKLMGYIDGEIKVGEKVQLGILELVQSVIDSKNANSYERFLFYILRDQRFSLNVQMVAQNMLKSFEVKAPGTL